MREECIVQKYYEITPEDGKDQSGKILVNGVDITDYTEKNNCRGLSGRTVLYGFSGSDDISESDDHSRKTDRGGGEDP